MTDGVLAHALRTMAGTPEYRNKTAEFTVRSIMPAIEQRRVAVWPGGFATWAWLDGPVSDEFATWDRPIGAEECSRTPQGESARLWVLSLVSSAPYSPWLARNLRHYMKRECPMAREIWYKRPWKRAGCRRIVLC